MPKTQSANLLKYVKLFTSTFYLSAFTFGGGFVIIPLMKKKFVDELQWLEEDEMLNIAAIAQSSPGSVAVNAAIFVGYRIAGVGGAAVAILGTILPPFIIISIISAFYSAFRSNRIVSAVLKGMQVLLLLLPMWLHLWAARLLNRENGFLLLACLLPLLLPGILILMLSLLY